MTGANIFVMYTDGNGNVTVSPRLGRGHFEPEHDRTANITVLEGSGVTRNRMVANVLCSNCERWNGGNTDFTSSSGSWIHASSSGSPIDSTDLNAEIEIHQDQGAFTWDYSSAQGGANVNPFVTQGRSSSNGGAAGGDQVSSAPSGSTNTDDSDKSSSVSQTSMMVTAHGTLAAVAFLVLFPIGAVLLRIPALGVWVHAGVQIFAYLMFITAAGLGINLAVEYRRLSNHHAIIGMVLLGVLFFQPLGGLLHHRAYKAKQSRSGVSYAHIWLGRAAVILGMINGGLGIQLAGDVPQGYLIAYAVVAGVMGLLFIGTMIYGESRSQQKGNPS
jgi:hypothetical protein